MQGAVDRLVVVLGEGVVGCAQRARKHHKRSAVVPETNARRVSCLDCVIVYSDLLSELYP